MLNNKVNELQIKTEEVTKDKIKSEQQAAVLEAKLESEKSISNDLKSRLAITETELKELRTETKAELQKTNQVLIKALNDAAELEKQLECLKILSQDFQKKYRWFEVSKLILVFC